MDNRKGNFEEINEDKFIEQMAKPMPMVFKVGEILEIRGSRLRIERIDKKKLILKLLPQPKFHNEFDESVKQKLNDLIKVNQTKP